MWDITRQGLCCSYGHTGPALPVLSSRQLLLLCPNRGAGRRQGPPPHPGTLSQRRGLQGPWRTRNERKRG